MVEIGLHQVGRRFNIHWIFREITELLKTNEHTVLLGSNGSGKSTLLKIISGILSPSEGSISYLVNGKEVDVNNIYKHLSICAPYLSLPEQLNLAELLSFHQNLKPLKSNFNASDFAHMLEIDYDEQKAIHLYSSGMKQRVKLALAIWSHSPILLLDEPLSNLDDSGKNWYKYLMEVHAENRLIIVASNHTQEEYFFCTKSIDVLNFKPDN